mgnify:CR=1 FL=1
MKLAPIKVEKALIEIGQAGELGFVYFPQLFAELIRSIKSIPNHAVLRIVRDVRDGNW